MSLTTDTARYVYLTDGGHFGNLGIFEMLKRRCRLIVVSDAGADPSFAFESLGIAVQRAYISLGIRIDFGTSFDLQKREATSSTKPFCAVGNIFYPERSATGDSHVGRLFYVKAGYRALGEPMNVRAMASADPRFPHDPTSNQFFDEKNFESYRALAAYIIDNGHPQRPDSLTLDDFMRDTIATRPDASVNTSGTPAPTHKIFARVRAGVSRAFGGAKVRR